MVIYALYHFLFFFFLRPLPHRHSSGTFNQSNEVWGEHKVLRHIGDTYPRIHKKQQQPVQKGRVCGRPALLILFSIFYALKKTGASCILLGCFSSVLLPCYFALVYTFLCSVLLHFSVFLTRI